ncbi:carbohydrate ABC transporter permease [Cohnella sp. WQ 127256]|uniref:carbohydrate ABC transporter permease n=1 Tax=Cohnella sp. WQ 127256 TaxID=2938790 RepID=UPI0021190E18|nr:carbohydrate ABC transporter permease [Cohnella sp. WQ 127256]
MAQPNIGITGMLFKNRKVSPRLAVNRIVLYTITIVFSCVFMIPFLWMISASLQSDTFTLAGKWFQQFLWKNYWDALTQEDFKFLPALSNTVYYTVVGTVFFLVSSVLVAYGFSYFRFPLRDKLFFFLLATMMIPSTVMFIPNYVMFANWGWTGTYWPLLIPALGGGPATVFLLRQFMLTLSISLFESAKIDGAGSFMILWKIVLPNIRAPLILILIQQVNGHWSDFFGPLMYVGNDPFSRTISVAITIFSHVYYVQWSYVMSAAFVMAIVPIILYFVSQKYLMQDFVLSSSEK